MYLAFGNQIARVAWLLLAVAASGVPAWGDAPTQVAADSELQGVAAWPAGRVITGASEAESRIYAALSQPFTHEFVDATLEDVARRLEKHLKSTVLLERAFLSADGFDLATKISYRARGRGLRIELRALLAPWRLKAIVRDDSLIITTQTSAEIHMPLRVYEVHDLVVRLDDSTVRRPQFEPLMMLIKGHSGSETWDDYGGRGNVRSFHGPGILALVVRQTEDTHAEIEQLLAQLRAARLEELLTSNDMAPASKSEDRKVACSQISSANQELESPSVPPPSPFPRGKVIYPLRTGAEQSIYRVMQQPAEFDFQAIRLDKFADLLAERYKIAVELDVPALIADGKGPETELTFQWHDGTLRSALRRLLDEQVLTFVVQDDALRLTTKSAAEAIVVTHLYQVNDLFSHDMRRIGRSAYFDVFQEMISGLVAPETWREGNRTHIDIFGFEAPGVQVLAIKQTQVVHEEIEQLLAMLRAAYEPKVYEAQRRRPVIAPPEPTANGVPGRGMF